MRRAPARSREEFGKYWLTDHAAYTKRRPKVSAYCQLHADDVLMGQLSSPSMPPADFDGLALMYTASPDDYVSVIRDAGQDGGLDDAGEFLDLPRSPPMGLCRVLL